MSVVLAKKLGSLAFGCEDAGSPQKGKESEEKRSQQRLLRVGLLTAVTLTAHNLPEGMAVAISTMGSVKLGLKLAVAIALHNIPEGLAITWVHACRLREAARCCVWGAALQRVAALLQLCGEPVDASSESQPEDAS